MQAPRSPACVPQPSCERTTLSLGALALAGVPPDNLELIIDWENRKTTVQFTLNHGEDGPRSILGSIADVVKCGSSLAQGAAAAPNPENGRGENAAPRVHASARDEGAARPRRPSIPLPRLHEMRHGPPESVSGVGPSRAPAPAARHDPLLPMQRGRRTGIPLSASSSRESTPASSVAASDTDDEQPPVSAVSAGSASSSSGASCAPFTPTTSAACSASTASSSRAGPSSGPSIRGAAVRGPPVKIEKVKAEKVVSKKLKEVLYPIKEKWKISKQHNWVTWYKTSSQEPLLGGPSKSLEARLGHIYVHKHAKGVQLWMYSPTDSEEYDEVTGKRKLAWRKVHEGCSHPKAHLENYELIINEDDNPRWVTHVHARKFNKDKRKMRRYL